MDEYEKIRQRKREEYRKRHRAQVRRKQLINNGIVIGMIILIIATIIIAGALRGKKAKQEEVKGLSVADEVSFGFLIVYKNLDKTLEIAELVRNLFELRQDDYFYRCDLTGTAEYYANDMYCQELTFKAITTR